MWQKRILDFYKASISSGKFNRILNKVELVDIQKERIVAEATLTKEECNPVGYLHGGMSATLVDVTTSIALRAHFESQEKSPPNTVSVELSLSFFAGVPEGKTIRIETDTLRVGNKIAFLQARIYDKETNRLVVTGKHTKYLM